jgi:hypothetical protein
MSNQNKVPKVLVVDDEPEVELLMRRAFRRRIRDREPFCSRARVERGSDDAGHQAEWMAG